MRNIMLLFVSVLSIMNALSVLPARGDEGMYLLDQIDDSMMGKMKKMGLELSLDEIYNKNGTGIAGAVINTGATASFVSPQGLLLTNHHVAFGAVQRISTPEQNYIENGFLAHSLQEEITAPGYQAYVILSMSDVTGEVLSAVKDGMSDYDRHMALEKRIKEMIRKHEEKGDVECDVKNMNYGSKYYLFTYLKIKDMRIVYVPPRSIGEYGGEVDNWMWPRHTGDFSFLRAYVSPEGKPAEYSKDNVPYKPRTYLKISVKGIAEGDFTMIMGFPGRTSRHLPSVAVEDDMKFRYPFQIRTIGDIIRILEEFSGKDEEAAVKLVGNIKGLYNAIKNNEGMLEGLNRSKAFEAAEAREKAVLGHLKIDTKRGREYGEVFSKISGIYEERRKYRERSSLMSWMERGLLGHAMTINKWTIEQQKKDQEREPGYQERDLPNIELRMKIAQKSLVPEADRKILEYFLKRAIDLPEGQTIEAVKRIFDQWPDLSRDEAAKRFLDKLYGGTKIISAEDRIKMLHMSREELIGQNDPFIQFASALETQKEIQRKRDKEFQGAFTRLMPLYLAGIEAWKKEALYPDANGTLRFNYGQVKGYSPRDGIDYRPVTSLRGIIEKDTGKEPFSSPERLLAVYREKDFGNWVDTKINDVPVDFLTTNDSTGGNSGSPVLNGRGELVGVLFDGTYESLFCDYNYDPDISRSIHVDVRYILFVAEKVDKALNVIEELDLVK